MQVDNRNYSSRNYSMMNNKPNFTSLRSVKCEGLYRKFPEQARELVDAFKKNPDAMDFCKKYDVDLVFYSSNARSINLVESSIHLFFDDISRGKFKKIWDKLNGNKEEVHLVSFANEWNIEESMKKTTSKLKDYILPERDGIPGTGVLSSHLQLADERIEEKLAKKAEKAAQKQTKIEKKQLEQTKQAQDEQALDNAIKDLMELGK